MFPIDSMKLHSSSTGNWKENKIIFIIVSGKHILKYITVADFASTIFQKIFFLVYQKLFKKK